MATRPEFTPDKYYVITKRKAFVFIIVLLGMTIGLIAQSIFAITLLIVKLA